MIQIGFLIYMGLFVISITLTAYNLLYTREVHRIEKNIGIALPSLTQKLLKIALVLSIGLSIVIAFMALITFFLPQS